ncbi:MAG: AIR synthase-related protein, partial [candidate division KSB1 bacterium]|nr:AIR synthase-related protein [candidate division KSB1 bacterium]
VRACHDCSEGGLAVAAAEMAFAGGLGMVLDLRRVPSSHGLQRNDKLLFSESNSRFVVEVPPESQQRFEQIMADNLFGLIGQAVAKPRFRVVGLNGNTIIEANIYELKEAWQRPLRW